MLILRGTLRAATQLGGGTNKKTGEVIPVRDVVQVETRDGRGLVQMVTLTVPDHRRYSATLDREAEFMVRAWAPGGAVVSFAFEGDGPGATT